MVYGLFKPLLTDNDAIYAYERELDGKRLVVACNWTKESRKCNLFDETEGSELISNYDTHEKGILKPYEARAVLI